MVSSNSFRVHAGVLTPSMYVTPPYTDVYSIPRVLAPMPQKYVRCVKKDYGCYHASEPPVEHLCDPLYMIESKIMMFFLTKPRSPVELPLELIGQAILPFGPGTTPNVYANGSNEEHSCKL